MATVGAFFVTQHLKVSTPLIAGFPHPYPPVINPYGASCAGVDHRTAQFSFYLYRADDVDVYVVDQTGTIVRTLASSRHMRIGVRVPDGLFPWDGRDGSGRVVPDGTYYFRIALRQQGRTIELTDAPLIVKTIPPHPVVTSVTPSLIPQTGAPVQIRYKADQKGGATVRIYRTDLHNGPHLVKSFLPSANGFTASWDGRIAQRPAPAGTYLIGIDVTDAACNTGHFPPVLPPPPGSTPHAGVTVRYLAAQSPLDPVRAGSRALVYVDSRQRPYRWTLQRVGARKLAVHGSAHAFALHVRLPDKGAGLYVLSIRSGGHRTSVPLIVRAPGAGGGAGAAGGAKLLVVLPALTWQGRNPVDDDGDGLPDMLTDGGAINLQRPLARGLPAGFADEAAFLAYLDKAHLTYDLTTDLALTDSEGPSLSAYKGVVLAGSEEWLPATLRSALRAYVQGGGHVLSLGIDSLRRGVTIRGGQALTPTAPAAADAFGARPGQVVSRSGDLIFVIQDQLGIFSSTSGALPGYREFQPFAAAVASPAQPISSAAGTSSSTQSIIGFHFGRGIVVEIGLPGFGSSVARNVNAQELVGRLWSVLGQ